MIRQTEWKIVVCRDVMSFSLILTQRFVGSCCLRVQVTGVLLRMEAVYSSETLVTLRPITWDHTPVRCNVGNKVCVKN
jgi:hypothetical protein